MSSVVKKPIHCIVACARNYCIGKDGHLPWSLPEDFAWFVNQTGGGVVIEGSKCFAELTPEITSQWPPRGVVVITRDNTKVFPGAEKAGSVEEAINIAQSMDEWNGPIWIGGGEGIYKESLSLCDKLYITRIHQDYEGDRFFPSDWGQYFTTKTWAKDCIDEKSNVEFTFEIWER